MSLIRRSFPVRRSAAPIARRRRASRRPLVKRSGFVPSLAPEFLESRSMLAAFTYAGTVLGIDLDNVNEAITLTAQGGGAYVFTSTSNFTGTDIAQKFPRYEAGQAIS